PRAANAHSFSIGQGVRRRQVRSTTGWSSATCPKFCSRHWLRRKARFPSAVDKLVNWHNVCGLRSASVPHVVADSHLLNDRCKEQSMNRDTIQGDWTRLKGLIKEKWGKLTDDDLKRTEGKREQLVGLLRKRYGLAKEEAERELAECEHACHR